MNSNSKKYDQGYIERCDKQIRNILEDKKEYDDWTQICLSVQNAVQAAANTWGCSSDQQKAQMGQFINELVIGGVLTNLSKFRITFSKIAKDIQSVGEENNTDNSNEHIHFLVELLNEKQLGEYITWCNQNEK